MKSAAWQGDWPVSQPYGCTSLDLEPWWPAKGCYWHCGVDIALPSGTALYAARSGLVTHRTLGILGIATASKEVDYYIHGSYPVLLGAIVKAGQRIGLSGNIMPGGGHTTGPHLHFERQGPGGVVNEPSSSRDPLPVLDPATYGPGSGTVVPDMTPEEHAALMAIAGSTAIRNPLTAASVAGMVAPLATTAQLAAAVADLKAAIQAVPSGAPADNAAVLAAIANVQAVVDKIDRGD